MQRITKTCTLTLVIALAASTQAAAKSPHISLEAESSCPREAMDVRQLTDCLGSSLALRHSRDSELEVRFDVAVFQRGRVEQVIASRPASIVGRQRIFLDAVELPETLEVPGGDTFVPGGDTFVPGGDTFVPGGDTFVRDEGSYSRFLAEAAEEREGEGTVIFVVARPHMSEHLPSIGISTTAMQLTVNN